jgi:hypothetical protein
LIRIVIRHRNGDTPFEISSDGAGTQTALKPCVDKHAFTVDYGIRGPLSLSPRLFDPLFRLRLNFIESHIHVGRNASYDIVGLVEDTTRVDKFHSVKSSSTSITLIAAGVLRTTQKRGRNREETELYI